MLPINVRRCYGIDTPTYAEVKGTIKFDDTIQWNPHNIGTHLKGIETSYLWNPSTFGWVISLFEIFSNYLQSLKSKRRIRFFTPGSIFSSINFNFFHQTTPFFPYKVSASLTSFWDVGILSQQWYHRYNCTDAIQCLRVDIHYSILAKIQHIRETALKAFTHWMTKVKSSRYYSPFDKTCSS
jgi:hypothetical protein